MKRALALASGLLAAIICVHEVLYYLGHSRRSGASLIIAGLAMAVCLLAAAVGASKDR
jgi:hypothetical protein